MGKNAWSILGIAAAIVVAYVSWKWVLSPEARVSRAVHAAAAAAERVDAPGFLDFFADDYSDFLNVDRAAFAARVREGFERADRLNVTLQSVEVEVENDTATVELEIVVVAFRGEERFVAMGTPFQPELVEAHLRREPSGWKLTRVALLPP